MNNVKERLLQFVKTKGLSVSAFEREIGVSSGYIKNISQSIQPDKLEIIARIYPELSIEWLLIGRGAMLKESTLDNIAEKMPALKIRDPKEKLIPLYRNEAAAGFGSPDFAIKESDIEGYYKIMEFLNADFMLRVRGDSMLPIYKPGDTIAVREIKQINFIQWGKPHLIAARYQGLLIKRIYPTEQRENVKMISENKELYPPFEVPMDEITGLALIIGTVRLDNF